RTGKTKGTWAYVMSFALPIMAVAFVVALLVVISFGLDYILFAGKLMPQDIAALAQVSWWWSHLPLQVIAALAALAISRVASRAININRFSLHAMYRNRLVRAFLGAAREPDRDGVSDAADKPRKRRADRFTGFDANDNPSMHDLWAEPTPVDWRPLHVINIALNIVSSRRLSWQERKAESFTVSPLHSGSSAVGYRSSVTYGGPDGISLGTAMAISGAAASPNMGYYSSPAI